MKEKSFSIGNPDYIQINFTIDEDELNQEPCGYIEFVLNNEIFGDKSIYTYLGFLEDPLMEFVKLKNKLSHKIFNDKTGEEIFDLMYLLQFDWDYSENLPIEQVTINEEFFQPFYFNTEEALEYETIYVLFENGIYRFLCKHYDPDTDKLSNQLFVTEIPEAEYEKTVAQFADILKGYYKSN